MFSLSEGLDKGRIIPVAAAFLLAIVTLSLLLPGTAMGKPEASGGPAVSGAPDRRTDVSSSQGDYGDFLKSAEDLYAAVNDDQPEHVRRKLRELESRFRILPMNGIETEEGIEAMAESIADLKRETSSASPDETKSKSDAASIRLAADALAHPDKPLWYGYRSIFLDDLSDLNDALNARTDSASPVPADAIEAFDRLEAHYRTIRASVMLRAVPSAVERADVALSYAERVFLAEAPNDELLGGAASLLQDATMALFPREEHATAIAPPVAGPPWGWSAMMGTFIVTVLTWVGWQRYKAEPPGGYPKDRGRTPPRDAAERILDRWDK